MIVCVCNAIREDDVRRAARCGAPCAESAYRSLGFEPQCRSCLCHADDIIREERSKLIRLVPRAA